MGAIYGVVESPPSVSSRVAHAESSPARLHTPSHHESVARLKDVEWTGEVGEGHCAHKDWQFFTLTETNPA